MPDYLVTDPATGQRIKMTGPAPPSEALIRLALSKVQPLPSHEPAVKQTADPLQAMQKAQTIGPARVGERYLEPLRKDLPSIARSIVGGEERPASVVEQDPSGMKAALMGAGTMPMPFMGSVEEPAMAGLYSRLEQAIAKLPDQKLPPMKILSTAKNATSGEEIAHRGLADFLQAAGGKPVARADVQAHLAANPIQLETKVLAESKGGLIDYLERNGEGIPQTPDEWMQLSARQERIAQQWQRNGDDDIARRWFGYAEEANQRAEGLNPQTGSTHGEPKYSRYQVPGGTAYKETLITLPPKRDPVKVGDVIPFSDDPYRILRIEGNQVVMENARTGKSSGGATLVSAEKAKAAAAGNNKPTFISSHFPDFENPVVHVRSNERTLPSGEQGLFLEEVQSDWHQKGKAEGYATKPDTSQWKATRAGEGDDGWWNVYDGSGTRLGTVRHGDVGGGGARTADQALQEVARRSKFTGVPDAPFKEQWPDLALKHQLLDAAKRPDLQWLGFTSGETQAARYDLSKQIESVLWDKRRGDLSIVKKGADRYSPMVHEKATADTLADYVGKDVAQRLIDAKPNPNGHHVVSGLDLQVGGEGMKYFYDQLLPKRLEKIVKPFGGTVERAPVSTAGGRPTQYADFADYQANQNKPVSGWIVRLTPEMKQRILKEGLPLMTGLAAVAAGQQEQK